MKLAVKNWPPPCYVNRRRAGNRTDKGKNRCLPSDFEKPKTLFAELKFTKSLPKVCAYPWLIQEGIMCLHNAKTGIEVKDNGE